MISAIDIRKKEVSEIMIKIENTYLLDSEKPISLNELNSILDKGFSRIPVYSETRNNLIGLLRIKQLVGIDITENKSLRELDINLTKPLVIHPKMKIMDLLSEFRKGKSHMAVITNEVECLQNKLGLNRKNSLDLEVIKKEEKIFNLADIAILGIITLEDVIENLIKLDIFDEDDYEKIYMNKFRISSQDTSRIRNDKLSKSFLIIFFREIKFE